MKESSLLVRAEGPVMPEANEASLHTCLRLACAEDFTDESIQPTTNVVARSSVMCQAIEEAKRFANSGAPVLITGESGTGKEVIARLIHQESSRAARRYVRVNCAALSESLIESELFGHEQGAFTGAADARLGRFEWAADGTILLDEISEIPVRLQAKLLRVLEEEEFQRVGSNDSKRMQARVIATSNRPLEKEVVEGRFREDLFFRLNVLQIHLPPLRQRREDIPLLVEFFRAKLCAEDHLLLERFANSAMKRLTEYGWPGNVRQLRNIVHRVCLLCQTQEATVSDLPPLTEPTRIEDWDPYAMTLRDVEDHLIRMALRRFQGNRAAAARHLGVTARTLHNRLQKDPSLLD